MRARRPAEVATDREVGVVAAVLVAGSEKAAAHRLGLSHSTVKHHLANARSKVGAETTAQLVWILAERLPEPEGGVQAEAWRPAKQPDRPHADHEEQFGAGPRRDREAAPDGRVRQPSALARSSPGRALQVGKVR